MKKLCKAATVFLLCAGALTGCGSKGDTETEKKMPVASVAQIVEHKSLNTVRDSFEAEMEALGYKDGENIKLGLRDAGGQQNTLDSIMSISAGNKSDVVVAIAIPTAMAVAKYSKDIPIVFSTVSDSVGADLVDDPKKPNNNITGTNDEIQMDQTLNLALKVDPDLKTLDLIYNSFEVNSVSSLAKAKEFCKKHDIKLVEGSGANITEIQSTVSVLTGKCDAVLMPDDNTVASSMSALVETADKKKVPVYMSVDSMVGDGDFATAGIGYTELGKETARVTDETLKGEDVENLPVRAFRDNPNIYADERTVETLGTQLPKGVENSKNLIMM